MSDDINRVKRVVFRIRRDGWWKFKTKSNAEKTRDQQKNRNRVDRKKCEIVGVPPTHRRIGKTADKIKNERRRRFAVRKESSPTASGAGRRHDRRGEFARRRSGTRAGKFLPGRVKLSPRPRAQVLPGPRESAQKPRDPAGIGAVRVRVSALPFVARRGRPNNLYARSVTAVTRASSARPEGAS